MNDKNHNTLEAAKRYAELGFYPVPIPKGTKGPRTKGWQELKIGPEQVPEYWVNGEGVGLLLGANGLACLDADTPEAVRILPVA
jgi:hypothetical protein